MTMRGQCILRAKQNVASEAHETSTNKAPRNRANSTLQVRLQQHWGKAMVERLSFTGCLLYNRTAARSVKGN